MFFLIPVLDPDSKKTIISALVVACAVLAALLFVPATKANEAMKTVESSKGGGVSSEGEALYSPPVVED